MNQKTLDRIKNQLAEYGIGIFEFDTEDIQKLLTAYEEILKNQKESMILKCRKCDGKGLVYYTNPGGLFCHEKDCDRCNSTGFVKVLKKDIPIVKGE